MTSTTQLSTGETQSPGATKPPGIYLVVLFAIYLVLLFWIVLWKLEIPWVGGVRPVIKLVPFVPSDESGPSTPFDVVVNFALFVPFGFYFGLVAPARTWWKAAAAVAGASVVLEATQYVLAIGSSDVTDVIVNTAGGLVGFGLLALIRRRLQARTVRVMTRIFSIGTVLAVIASGIFLASPMQYRPPQDRPMDFQHPLRE